MTGGDPPPLLAGTGRLTPGDAATAIIMVDQQGYLMQLRDRRPDIWYPDHWGLFGGGVEPGEDPRAALARELREELELELGDAELFACFEFDLPGLHLRRYVRSYYLVDITRAEAGRLVLHEGAAMRIFAATELLQEPRLCPHDSFALFLHYARARLDPTA